MNIRKNSLNLRMNSKGWYKPFNINQLLTCKQFLRSLTPNQKVPDSISGLVACIASAKGERERERGGREEKGGGGMGREHLQ